MAANSIARALSPEFIPGQNSLRWRLLEAAARELYVNWDEVTEVAVNGLRELSAICRNDARMHGLVAELSLVSARFRELWSRGEVGYRLGSIICSIPKSASFISTGSASTLRIPAGTTY